jgi:hypothetical protein
VKVGNKERVRVRKVVFMEENIKGVGIVGVNDSIK